LKHGDEPEAIDLLHFRFVTTAAKV